MSTPAWALAGNSGPDLSADFLGTTDKNPLIVKTANIERLRVDFAGNAGMSANLGIGSAFRGLAKTPTSQLHIDVAASPTPISGLNIDVESFQTPANAKASHFLQVRDIGAAPPAGFTHFIIRGDGTVGIGT